MKSKPEHRTVDLRVAPPNCKVETSAFHLGFEVVGLGVPMQTLSTEYEWFHIYRSGS